MNFSFTLILNCNKRHMAT